MKPIIALTNFQQRVPPIQIDQDTTLDHIIAAHALAPDFEMEQMRPLLKRYAVKSSQIHKRHFENTTLSHEGADILKKTQFFSERGREVIASFFPTADHPPEQLIHVTCTGYVSPSPAQHLVNDRGWSGKTGVTHAYHMGCYAALPAIRISEGLVAAGNHRVDIVHTEMCSLHMDRSNHSPEQIVVQSLFSDGHIKYSAVPLDEARSGYKVLAISEWIIPNSEQDMSWITAPWGMKMTLSREVPTKIGSALRPFVMALCDKAEVSFVDVIKNGIFAIHPGGPKVIDGVREHLELSELQVSASREVLFERGNMSSATLPHVWDKLLQSKRLHRGQKVLSLAFGPGLTLFGAVFESI